MQRARRRLRGASLGAVLLLGLLSGAASATPLGLVLEPSPDLFVGFGSTSYSAAGDSLTLTAQPQDLFVDPTTHAISAGLFDFSLSATIDGSGSLVSGTLSVSGTVPTLGFNSGTLLTGTLTAFGFDSGTPALPFEFLFTVTGGEAASLYGGNGATAGIILSHNSSFTGSFGSDFSSSFVSVGDVGVPVPEPSAAVLLALAVVVGVRLGRRT